MEIPEQEEIPGGKFRQKLESRPTTTYLGPRVQFLGHLREGKAVRDQLDQADLFLEKLSQENPDLLADVKKYYLTFEDIFKVDENSLRDILNSVELDDIPMAMKGMDEALAEQAINVLPKKKQAMYEPVEGAVSKRDITDARRKIMEQVRKMQADGQINITDLLSGEMVE